MKTKNMVRATRLGVVLAAFGLAGCATGTQVGEPLASGASVSSTFTRAPTAIDGVNGTLFEIKIPALNVFGDAIKMMDPATGEERITYADVRYEFVPDEPIAGEIAKITWKGVVDIGTGGAISAIACALNGCKSGHGGGLQVVNVSNQLMSRADVNATLGREQSCPGGLCG